MPINNSRLSKAIIHVLSFTIQVIGVQLFNLGNNSFFNSRKMIVGAGCYLNCIWALFLFRDFGSQVQVMILVTPKQEVE